MYFLVFRVRETKEEICSGTKQVPHDGGELPHVGGEHPSHDSGMYAIKQKYLLGFKIYS